MVDGRTDNRAWLYYKLTNEPKGSGELIIHNNLSLFTFIGFLAIWLVEQLVSYPMNCLNKSEALLSANLAGFLGL